MTFEQILSGRRLDRKSREYLDKVEEKSNAAGRQFRVAFAQALKRAKSRRVPTS